MSYHINEPQSKMNPAPTTQPCILLSFDAEEFSIPNELGHPISGRCQLDVGADGLRRVLNLLTKVGIQATFFTTVRLAQASVGLVHDLHEAGHELASHGMSHEEWTEVDLYRSRKMLEYICGTPVSGFRRARFAHTSAFALREAGYAYDSSEHPAWIPGRYNGWRTPRYPRLESGIVRLPVSVSPIFRLPLFWLAFKNYPRWLYYQLCSWTLKHDRMLALVFHPWEFCEISDFGLPNYTCHPDSSEYLCQLEELLSWLKGQAAFMRYDTWINQMVPHRERNNKVVL